MLFQVLENEDIYVDVPTLIKTIKLLRNVEDSTKCTEPVPYLYLLSSSPYIAVLYYCNTLLYPTVIVNYDSLKIETPKVCNIT